MSSGISRQAILVKTRSSMTVAVGGKGETAALCTGSLNAELVDQPRLKRFSSLPTTYEVAFEIR
jgi:hypothetical protein